MKDKNKDKSKIKEEGLNPNQGKPKSKEPKEIGKGKGGTFRSCNDIKWYSQSPSLLRDSGSIQYSEILGLPTSISSKNGSGAVYDKKLIVPGIMSLHYIPGVGVSTDMNSNINVAARLVYTFIRHANSGSRNYESPDLMTYLLAVSNAQAYYAYLVRLYGLINHHSVLNRYVTKALVTAAGGNYEDLVNRMANFRYYINYYANKLNSLAVPKDQYYFDREAFLPLHVFTDGEGSKAQMYIFNPEGFYLWSGTAHSTGSSLVFTALTDDATLDDLIQYGDDLLNSLLSNEDIGMMSGDVLKAFGAQGIRQVQMIPSEFVTPIIRDEGILAQIHNATFVGPISQIKSDSLDITQADGELQYQLVVQNRTAIQTECLMDTWLVDPTPEFNMEASRLITLCEYSGTTGEAEVVTSGTEVLTSMYIWKYDTNGTLINTNTSTILTTGLISAEAIADISKFDWYPLLYIYSNTSGTLNNLHVIGDLQNYTKCDFGMINRMHNCAIQSLFNVFGLYIKTK